MLANKGARRTAGSIHHRYEVAAYDAPVVERIRKAGAIPMGTTNVPELGFWFECSNPVYGRTNNPYDVTRTCGGSSGGEAALLGAGASPFGLGSDIGGSIRMPAFFCGVYGHKPTNRVVPITGHFPFDPKGMGDLVGGNYPYTTVGPMSRSAKDLLPLLNLIAGEDTFDRETRFKEKFKAFNEDWSSLTVYVLADPIFHGARETDSELVEATWNVARVLSEYGATIRELDPKIFVSGIKLWSSAIKSSKSTTFAEALSPHQKIDFAKELLLWSLGKPNYTLTSILTALVESTALGVEEVASHKKDLEKLRQHLIQILGDKAIILMPPHSRVAPKHYAPLLSPFDFVYTAIINALQFPATVAPTGFNHEGLPCGVQIVAAPFQDPLTIAVAELVQSTFGGWKAPR